MCNNNTNSNGNNNGNSGQSRSTIERREKRGSFDYSEFHNDAKARITTTSQGTNGNPPEQGE